MWLDATADLFMPTQPAYLILGKRKIENLQTVFINLRVNKFPDVIIEDS